MINKRQNPDNKKSKKILLKIILKNQQDNCIYMGIKHWTITGKGRDCRK